MNDLAARLKDLLAAGHAAQARFLVESIDTDEGYVTYLNALVRHRRGYENQGEYRLWCYREVEVVHAPLVKPTYTISSGNILFVGRRLWEAWERHAVDAGDRQTTMG